MKSAFSLLALAALFFFCLPAGAQSCANAYPWFYDATYACARSEGPCSLSQPVTFSASTWSSAPLSCATVDWDFGDGSPVVSTTADVMVPHTYAAAGIYPVVATFRANTYSSTDSFTIRVANGALQWSDTRVTEGQTASFTVTRVNTGGETSMTWSLLRPDGSVPTDVTPASGTVTLPAGVAVARFDVATVDDAAYAPERHYRLQAGTPTGGFLPPDPIELRVDDNDQPILDFATGTQEVTEQDGIATVTVRRVGGDLNVPVGVNYYVYSTIGVSFTSGTLTFAAGELSRSFNVVLTNDTIWTGKRTATVELYAPSGGARFPNFSYSIYSSLVVLEDEPNPSVSVSATSMIEGNGGRTRGSFVVTSSDPIYRTLSYRLIGVTAREGEDFIASSGVLFFTPYRQSITVSFDLVGDTMSEEDEILQVEFVSLDAHPDPHPALLTIVNDDAGVAPSKLRVPAGGSGAAYVDIGAAATSPLVIAVSSSAPSVASVPDSITIPAGERKAILPIAGFTAHGAAEITVQFPPERGGTRFVVMVDVDGSAQLAFEPSKVKAVAGQHVPLQIRMQPAPPNALELPLEVLHASVVKAPRGVVIGMDGIGTLEVETLQPGFTVLRATLPDTYGGRTAMLDVEVVAASDAPALTSLTPATGPTAGGTRFTAFGSLLTAGCTLSFGGAPAASLTLGTDGTLTGLTPPHAAGTVDVALACGTSHFTLSRAFTYLNAPPALTSIAPTFGSIAGGTLVRATGTNFRSGCWLFFGDQPARGVAVDSTTSLVGTAPPREAPGAVHTSVRCGDAIALLPSSFAYANAAEPDATLVSVSPLVGAPGEQVTLTGSRFRTSDRIDFDGIPVTILRTRPDELTVRIPELPLGLAAITLTTAEGRFLTTGPIFTVVEPNPPQVAKVTPSQALPGSEIVLEGRGFRPAYTFAVGGLPATLVSLDYDRAIVRLADALTPGEYPVHVLNTAGKVAAVGPSMTIRDGALRITTITPPCGTTDGGTLLVITGTGFAEGATVTLNGTTIFPADIVSETELRAIAPPGIDGPATLIVTNPDGTETRITGTFRYASPFDPQGCVH